MAALRLSVEEGYNRGAVYPLGDEPVVVGRGDSADVQLLSDSVSRRHAELRREGDRLLVRDLSSRNGVRVNGCPVERAEVFVGDRIALGSVRLVLQDAVSGECGDLAERPTAEHEPVRAASAQPATCRLVPGPANEDIVGSSPALLALLRQLERVAPTGASVLVRGESGTGKELIARALHRLSPRRRGPFVVVNSAALAEGLVESELFGHERGAFTGALARKMGLTEAAAQGTLFLDEVGELSRGAQAKLLRFLESGESVRSRTSRSWPCWRGARLGNRNGHAPEEALADVGFRGAKDLPAAPPDAGR